MPDNILTASSDSGGWNVAYTIATNGEKTITFKTENKFLDKDARVTITTPSAGNPTLNLNSNINNLILGESNNGVYSPTVTFTGTVAHATAGWVTNGSANVNANNVGVGTIPQVRVGITADRTNILVTPEILRTQKPNGDTWIDAASGVGVTTKPSSGPYVRVDAASIISNASITGKVSSNGYGTTTDYLADNATTIVGGTNAAETKYIPITLAAGFVLNVANSTGISGSSNVSVGTLTNGKYPIIANNLSVTGTFQAGTPGWFTSTQVSDTDVDSSTVGAMPAAEFITSGNQVSCSVAGYVPIGAIGDGNGTISAGSISAVATDPGNNYTENTSVVLASGGWLQLTAGYYNATKISLATLVPNGSNITGYANYILEGYSAYDNDGNLVTGSMDTYEGGYTIT